MRWRLKKFLILISVGVFILVEIPIDQEHRASAQSKPVYCTNVILSGVLPQPKDSSKAALQTTTLNNDCSIQEGPIEYIDKSSIQPETDAVSNTQAIDVLSAGNLNADHIQQGAFLREIYARSEIRDPAGIKLSALYTKNKWAGTGVQVTGYQISPWSSWHQDGAGLGWRLVVQSQNGGCGLPCNTAGFNQHAEFDYRGSFDWPNTGNYFNIHDNGQSLSGNGGYSCTFNFTARNWFPGWSWVKSCS